MEGENQGERDARVEELWKTLDTRKEGRLDANGLKRGLEKIDHPLKNADTLLQDVLKALDKNGDGVIQYSEFRSFVEQTEKELWRLFQSIDRDQNGQLSKGELRSAFTAAGLLIPSSKLDQFFSEVDTNHDGMISFEEWRNFLLFIPTNVPNLKAILSYYSSTVTVNAEGDVHVSDENLEGIGTRHFLTTLFGALWALSPRRKTRTNTLLQHAPYEDHWCRYPCEQCISAEIQRNSHPWDPGPVLLQAPRVTEDGLNSVEEDIVTPQKVKLLTDLLPEPGYFIAGGVAGVVSRTATAPLDRLKVYLIAQVGIKDETVNAAKSGAPVKAVQKAARPLVDAAKQLWRMGGIRSMFAGNGLNVVKVMPESAIKFGSYEGSKRLFARLEGHEDPKYLNPWSQFFAAGLGGMISQFAIYPLDTLKFRMQCETVEGGLHGNSLIAATALKMWRTTGFRSFYRGLPMGLLGMFPYSAIDLTTFEYLKQGLMERNAHLLHTSASDPATAPSNFATATIGAFSGAFGASVVYPMNLLRTRLQSQGTAIHPPIYTGIMDVAVKTVRGEGARGLFKGITPNLLKVVPAVSITYVVYDNTKRVLHLS